MLYPTKQAAKLSLSIYPEHIRAKHKIVKTFKWNPDGTKGQAGWAVTMKARRQGRLVK